MPHATNRYPFEWKILEWAGRLSSALNGNQNFPFLTLFAPDGRVRQVHFGDAPEQRDDSIWQRLRETTPSWLAYDPFEGPVYTYVHWHEVQRATIERLLRTPFTPEDLPAGDQAIEFPPTWGVMF